MATFSGHYPPTLVITSDNLKCKLDSCFLSNINILSMFDKSILLLFLGVMSSGVSSPSKRPKNIRMNFTSNQPYLFNSVKPSTKISSHYTEIATILLNLVPIIVRSYIWYDGLLGYWKQYYCPISGNFGWICRLQVYHCTLAGVAITRLGLGHAYINKSLQTRIFQPI